MGLPVPLRMGDVLKLKKPHACGENRWEITRLGADIKLRCARCGRTVMLPRSKLERRIKQFLERGPEGPAAGAQPDPPSPADLAT